MKTRNTILSLCLALPLAACSPHDHDHDGSVVIGGGGGGPVHEVEPNDHAWNANSLGSVQVGDSLQILGHITECCPDEYDGFAFYAIEPVSVHITLFEDNPLADLDFAIYIPAIDDFVAAYETDNHPEFGIFDQGGPGEFHVVINSWTGDSSYTLQVDVQPLIPAATAPGGGSGPSSVTIERFGAYRDGVASDTPPMRIELRQRELPSADAEASEAPPAPGD